MNSELNKLLKEILETDPSTADKSLLLGEFPGWDSLRHVQLIVGLQSAFGVRLEREEIQSIQSVGDIEKVLRDRNILVE